MGNRTNNEVALTGGARTIVRGREQSGIASLLDGFLTPEPWVQDAACAQTDPEAFFPETGGTTRPVKRVCNGVPGDARFPVCMVRAQCLKYALDHDERFGVWGGLSERERRRLRRNPAEMEATFAAYEQHGVPPVQVSEPRSYRPWTQRDMDAIRVLNGQGLTDKEIGRRLGRNRVDVTKRRAVLGIPRAVRRDKGKAAS